MQSNGQTSMQTPQPLQLSGWTIAIGRSSRFRTLVTLPQVSRIASSGQMTPHAPQSMQSAGSMKKAFFGSPLMARVGQRFSQAVQPVQFSATIVKGMLLLHFLQDLVGPTLLDQLIVATRLLETDPGEEEDEEQHAGDRDVVGLQKDVEELIEATHVLHAFWVTTSSRDVNENYRLRPVLMRQLACGRGLFSLKSGILSSGGQVWGRSGNIREEPVARRLSSARGTPLPTTTFTNTTRKRMGAPRC